MASDFLLSPVSAIIEFEDALWVSTQTLNINELDVVLPEGEYEITLQQNPKVPEKLSHCAIFSIDLKVLDATTENEVESAVAYDSLDSKLAHFIENTCHDYNVLPRAIQNVADSTGLGVGFNAYGEVYYLGQKILYEVKANVTIIFSFF